MTRMGIIKNLKAKEWKYVNALMTERKKMNKESHVYINGIRVPQNKVERETARNGFQTTLDRVKGCMCITSGSLNSKLTRLACSTAATPRVIADILVRTPSPPARAALLDNIPWLHFQKYVSGRRCYEEGFNYIL